MSARVLAARSRHSMVSSTEDWSGFAAADQVLKSSAQGAPFAMELPMASRCSICPAAISASSGVA